jgi:hypothetical protein
MITLKSLITEGKKVSIPVGGEKISFSIMPSSGKDIIVLAGSNKDHDKLQDVISFLPARGVPSAIQSYLEKQLNVPLDYQSNHPSAGFVFKIDLYSLLNKVR